MKPVVNRLESEFSGKVRIVRYMTTSLSAAGEKLAQQFNVQYTPTFVFIDKSGQTSSVLIGQQDESVMRTQLQAIQ